MHNNQCAINPKSWKCVWVGEGGGGVYLIVCEKHCPLLVLRRIFLSYPLRFAQWMEFEAMSVGVL